MSTLPESLRLYLKLALERRQILARRSVLRMAFAAAAIMLLLVGLGLLNLALYLALQPYLGSLASVLLVAAVHLGAGGVLAALALREPASSELSALAEAEAAALHMVSAEAGETQHRIGQFGATLGAAAIPTLVGLIAGVQAKAAAGKQGSAAGEAAKGDKT